MKKRKINKRVLAVALALVVFASLFTVGASAMSVDEVDLCECIMTQSFIFTREDVQKTQENGGVVSLVCSECHRDYNVDSDFQQYLSYGSDWDVIKFTFYVGEGNNLFLRGMMFNGYKTVAVSNFQVNGLTAPSLDIENACDCIYLDGVHISYEDMAQFKANKAPIVYHCPTCLLEYSFTIDWNEFPTNVCDGYDLILENYEDGNNLVIGIVEDNEAVRVLNSPLQSVSASKGNRYSVGQMVGTMTSALGGILVGVGSSIVGFFDNTVLDANGELTTFATWALAFLGIAFGLGVVKFITFLVKK